MKKRLFLLTILAVLVWSYFPETRRILMQAGAPVVVPVMRWSAEEEMAQIARNVVEHERLTGRLPLGAEWIGWLDYRYSSEDMKYDPWRSLYQLELMDDSVAILSLGPDRVRATNDDFRVFEVRG